MKHRNDLQRRSVHVILLAGGIGSRFGADSPKQFADLLGRPVLAYSLSRFAAWLDRLESDAGVFSPGALVLVSHRDYSREALDLAAQTIPHRAKTLLLAEGGPTRHASSVNGMVAVKSACGLGPSDLCLIHDVARPYVPREDLDRLLEVFVARPSEFSAASLVSAVSETLVEGVDGHFLRGLDRERVYAVKTPQALNGRDSDLFISCQDQPEFTDLLRWAEAHSLPAALVAGSPLNLKLTSPGDRILLEAVLESEQQPR